MLALNYMMVGRVYYVEGAYKVAREHYDEARKVFSAAKEDQSWLMGSNVRG